MVPHLSASERRSGRTFDPDRVTLTQEELRCLLAWAESGIELARSRSGLNPIAQINLDTAKAFIDRVRNDAEQVKRGQIHDST